GCGYGIMTARLALARRELRLLALDSDPRKVEVARAALGRDLGVELVCADLRDPAAAEGPVDAGTCIDRLHSRDPPAQRALLGALVARLRPGGVLLLRDGTRDARAHGATDRGERFARRIGFTRAGSGLFFPTEDELRASLDACGVAVESTHPELGRGSDLTL